MTHNNTVPEIKGKLDELDIEYTSDMRKDDLLSLLPAETKTYVVVKRFRDVQDDKHVYTPDDLYPREENADVSQERIDELVGTKNKQGKQLIREQG